jgi:hypothetical protein
MSIESDVAEIMRLVDVFGELCEWNGARPGDDEHDKRGESRRQLEDALRVRLAQGTGNLSPIGIAIKRPESFDYSLSFLGGKYAVEMQAYVELLERKAAQAQACLEIAQDAHTEAARVAHPDAEGWTQEVVDRIKKLLDG